MFKQALSAQLSPMLRRPVLASLLEVTLKQQGSCHISCAAASTSCRFQSSCAATAEAPPRQELSPPPRRASPSRVNPSVRQRRPHVNGQAIAFHVRDLMPQHSSYNASATAAVEPEQPPASRKYESDLVVVLDMDECMIHSQFLSNPMAAHVMAHQLQNKRRNNASSSSSGNGVVDHFRIQLPDGGDLVHVNVRPGLTDFLEEITSRYETHIFTAAMPIYAKPVLDQLDPDNTKFAARWYRQHCTWDEHRNAYVKDLSALPLANMSRTVLVDNNPLSFLSHPSNGILVSSFYDDPKDTTLVAVKKLLAELEPHEDVRPLLEHQFGLKEALVDVGKV